MDDNPCIREWGRLRKSVHGPMVVGVTATLWALNPAFLVRIQGDQHGVFV